VLVVMNEPAARPPRPDEAQAGKDRREKSRRAKKAAPPPEAAKVEKETKENDGPQ